MKKEDKIQCEKGILEAIKLAGSQLKLAELCGKPVTQTHVSYWKNYSKKISATYVVKLEKLFKGKLTRHQMRPDLYPEA